MLQNNNNKNALHPRDDIDRLYVSRKEGEREFTNIEDCIDASIQRLKKNTKMNKEILITAANNSNGNVKNKQKNNKN